MILTRIKRGATRTFVQVGLKLERFTQKPSRPSSNFVRNAALYIVMARVMTFSLTPVHAATTAGLLTDDTDPSPTFVLPATHVVNASITFNPTASSAQNNAPFSEPQYALATISVGTSYATEEAQQAAALAAQQAAAQQAAQVAAQQAKTKEAQQAAITLAKASISQEDLNSDYDAYFQEYFGSSWKIAKAIGEAESHLNPLDVSSTNDYGIMQIHNGLAKYGPQIFDPETNIRIAAQDYWAGRGFSPWSTYKSGAYLRYYNQE